MMRNVSIESGDNFECRLANRRVNLTVDVDRIYDRAVENERFYIYMPSIEAQLLDFTLNGDFNNYTFNLNK